MKCTIPEISWHNRDPVLSLDVQPSKTSDALYRLATGGTDSHVLIWLMSVEKGGVASLECAADLTRHTKPVNCVRFSPSGELLASGDDESCIIIWKMKTSSDPVEFPTGEEETFKEQWTTVKVLRGHLQDVYDLSWSPDSKNLISGSVDNTAIMWDVLTGKNLGILSEHKGFVQGVAWDPCNQFVATISSDRVCRVYNSSQRRVIAKMYKGHLPGVEAEKASHYFHDDTLKSFFRRLSFTPDGELLIVPSGIVEEPSKSPSNCTVLFSRKCLNKPAAFLPSLKQYTVAVRCCPVLFTLRPMESPPLFALPYRVVIAVATQCSVVLYDTQHAAPFAFITKIHYTRLTDLSWSSDGRVLVVSSTDGYCSVITFAENELGAVYTSENKTTEESKPKEAKSNDIIKNGTSDTTSVEQNDNAKLGIVKNGSSPITNKNNKAAIAEEKTVNVENSEKPVVDEVINLIEDSMDVIEQKEEEKKEASNIQTELKTSHGNKETPMDVDDDFQLVYEGTITEPVLETKTEIKSSEQSAKIENKSEEKLEDSETADMDKKCEQSPNKSNEVLTHLQQEAFTSPRNTGNSSRNITPGSNSKKTPRRVQLITLSSPKSKKKLLE